MVWEKGPQIKSPKKYFEEKAIRFHIEPLWYNGGENTNKGHMIYE